MKSPRKLLILSPYPNTSGGVSSYVKALKGNWSADESYFFRGNAGKGKIKKIAFTIERYLSFALEVFFNPSCKAILVNTSMDKKAFKRDRIFILLSKLSFKKVYVFIHGWNQAYFEKIPGKQLNVFFKADKLFVLSKDFKQQLEERGYQKKIIVETTVVDRKFIAHFPLPEAEHIQGSRFLYLARLEKEKGILLLLNVFQRLSQKYPHIQLNVAGFGSLEETVKRTITAFNNPNIHFHGLVEGEEKTALFQQSNIFVLPTSHGEGMPISILEAMAAGLAVITTHAGALGDFFQDEKMGFKMQQATLDELEEKMTAAIALGNVGEMGEYNYKFARTHFTVQKVIERLENEIWEPTANQHKPSFA